MTARLDSEVAFVVGASSGIGKAVAERFAREGAQVAVADIREEPRGGGRPTHEVIRDDGGEAEFFNCDLTDQSVVDDAVGAAVDTFGGIDIGFNSAGAMTRGPITETEESDMEMVIDVNLKGPMRFAKGVLPELIESDGTLINISSEAGERGIENLPVYCASKGGVNTLTKQLAVEFGQKGVNVNAIAPGTTKTAINEEVREENPEWVEERRKAIPIGLLNEPEDIAELATYLASDGARKVNGAVVNIDGGTTAE
ncbi:SDR family NAD(P)-dependent oxidoreductase [Haloarcula halophila]|uniref:SDR family NAD(P)-dependent oxidoreductase n=1 Tax=Haloarcula TaxID=2237 RepID=UPI0023E44F07|nr:SDR family oxidoreductase [Halomicroarcula sp. DFY41]